MSAPGARPEPPISQGSALSRTFASVANSVAQTAGSPTAFAFAALTIVVWLLVGPYYDYSDTWQLVVNTGTTIMTFLTMLLIQSS